MRRPSIQIAISSAIIVTTLAAAPSKPNPSDAFDVYLQQVAKGVRNCGRTYSGATDRGKVDACVMAAFAAQEPFVVRYDQMGIDSVVAKALFLSREKLLSILYYDGPGSEVHPCIQFVPCGSPKVLKAMSGIRVECANAEEM
jgi:hypothetical protein